MKRRRKKEKAAKEREPPKGSAESINSKCTTIC